MDELKEKIIDLLEHQDDLTELEYLQEKDLLIQRCMLIMSDVIKCYELLS